jgi:hypothetical protein
LKYIQQLQIVGFLRALKLAAAKNLIYFNNKQATKLILTSIFVKAIDKMTRPSSAALLLLVANAGVIFGQIPGFGRCPDYPVVSNFEPAKYLGKWYEVEKYFTIFELGGTCITATYTDLGNGTIGVFNAMTEMLSRKRRTISGTAVLDNPSDRQAKLLVEFPSVPCK